MKMPSAAAVSMEIAAAAHTATDVLEWARECVRLEAESAIAKMWPLTACGRGCNHCCRLSEVHALPVEVAVLHLAVGGGDAYRQRLAAARPDAACPLLGDDGGCSAYQDRPAACRGEHSLDAAACAVRGGSHPYYEQMRALPNAVCFGGQAGFASNGLDTHPVVLRAALAEIVDMQPDEPLRRWLGGERLFQRALANLGQAQTKKLLQIQRLYRRK